MKKKIMELAAAPPPVCKQAIEDVCEKREFDRDRYMRAFQLSIGKSPINVKARALEAPTVRYKRKKFVPSAPDRRWNWEGDKQFITAQTLEHWGILVLAPDCDLGYAREFGRAIVKEFAKYGVHVKRTPTIPIRHRRDNATNDLENLYTSISMKQGQSEFYFCHQGGH